MLLLVGLTTQLQMNNSTDCLFLAHSDAFLHAEVLHRDLSPGNIMIGPNNKGLLIDWDLSKPLRRPNISRRATRTVRVKAVSHAVITHKY
jgi:serine/threonine protein kinase